MDKVKQIKALTAYPAMFFAGLILLIPHRIGMSRVNYVIKRYNLPISRAGLLLYKYHNNIELSLTIGTFIGNIINWVYGELSKGQTSESGLKGLHTRGRLIVRYLMVIFLFLMLISSIIMYIIYISGGDFGHLNAFYFSLIFLTIVDGFANAFAFALNGKYSSMLSAGIPLSGFLVTLLHYIYKFFSDGHNWDDFDYYVLRLQLICNIIIIFIALILWSLDQIFDIIIVINHCTNIQNPNGTVCDDSNPTVPATTDFNDALNIRAKSNNDGVKWNTTNQCVHDLEAKGLLTALFTNNTGNDSNYGDWSPIGMLAISLGTVYAFYPSIAPYSIIDYQYASIIELWILIISAIIPLLFAILDFASDKFIFGPATKQLGPSGIRITGSSFNNWKPGTGIWYWHLAWLCAIPYILCIQIFMSMLHYPDCSLSCLFKNPLRIGFISILFNTLREVLQALGFAGAGKQNYDTGSSSTKVNGYIAPTNKLITLFVMMFCVFTGDGYLQHYRRCCRDCWPTTGYNKYQSFFYWLHYGFKGGIKSITSSFTDLYYHNLRPQFISYA